MARLADVPDGTEFRSTFCTCAFRRVYRVDATENHYTPGWEYYAPGGECSVRVECVRLCDRHYAGFWALYWHPSCRVEFDPLSAALKEQFSGDH